MQKAFIRLAGLAGLGAISFVGFWLYVENTWDRPTGERGRPLTASTSSAAVARGEHLFNEALLCWSCHLESEEGVLGDPVSGGRVFDLSDVGPGFGIFYGTNLTPDRETGIGAWSDAELVSAIREGRRQDGSVLFPVMPYQFLQGMSDEDALSLVAYMRSRPPRRHEVPSRKPAFPFKALAALGVIRPNPPIAEPQSAPPPGPTVEYGKYLAWSLSGCAECHMPRSFKTGEIDHSQPFSGGLEPFPERDFWITGSNLTPDPKTGIGAWTEEEFFAAMKRGERPDGRVLNPFMPWPLYARWTDTELRAVWRYLKSLRPVERQIPLSTLKGPAAEGTGGERGEGLYAVYCRACHGSLGRGAALTDGALRDAIKERPADQIAGEIAVGFPDGTMPGFEKTLSKDQILDIIAYLRTWK